MKIYKNTHIIFHLLILFCFIHCEKQHVSTDPTDTLTIMLDQNEMEKKDAKLSDIVDSYRMVTLETTPNSLIGQVSKVKLYKGKIFVLDFMNARTLFVFSSTGKFLNRIGKSGQAPGDYMLPMDFTFDKKNDDVIMVDGEQRQLTYYDVLGTHKKTIKLDFFVEAAEYVDDNTMLLNGTSVDDKLIIMDAKYAKSKTFFPYKKYESITIWHPFQNYQDSLTLFRLAYKDTIFKINKDTVRPFRIINFKNEDKSFLKTATTRKDYDKINNYLGGYMEFKNQISLGYSTKRPIPQSFTVFIDKESGHKKYYQNDKFLNDIFYDNFYLNVQPNPNQDEIVFVLYPSRVLEIRDENEFNIVNKEVEKQISDLDENSNPALIFAKMKRF